MFTRRQFLEDSILTATAALAGPALAASAAEPKKSSANERLSVAVIGTGIRGPVHAGAFAGRGDCDVVAICDADMNRAGFHADGVGKRQRRKVAAYQDLRKIIDEHLADNGVDIDKTPLTVGPWLQFDPDQEQFVGNAAADAMLTREYRQPFVVPTESEV